MRENVRSTKMNLRQNRENLNELSKSFRQIGEYDTCAKYELQDQLKLITTYLIESGDSLDSRV